MIRANQIQQAIENGNFDKFPEQKQYLDDLISTATIDYCSKQAKKLLKFDTFLKIKDRDQSLSNSEVSKIMDNEYIEEFKNLYIKDHIGIDNKFNKYGICDENELEILDILDNKKYRLTSVIKSQLPHQKQPLYTIYSNEIEVLIKESKDCAILNVNPIFNGYLTNHSFIEIDNEMIENEYLSDIYSQYSNLIQQFINLNKTIDRNYTNNKL